MVFRLIVNGFGIYTTWTVIASLLNFTHALCYGGGVDLQVDTRDLRSYSISVCICPSFLSLVILLVEVKYFSIMML